MCATSLILLAALDLGVLFAEKDAWTGQAEFFAVDHAKDGFEFASEDRTIVNCLKHDTCSWYGNKVWEAKVYFDKGGEEEKVSRVGVPDYQLSRAIGKEGQNARLAAKLTGWKIDIKSESQAADEVLDAGMSEVAVESDASFTAEGE